MAIAAGARLHGASLYQNTEVTKMDMRSDGTWDVITPKGTVHANRVVNCTGILTSLLRFDNSIIKQSSTSIDKEKWLLT